jgi:hypothetical protein
MIATPHAFTVFETEDVVTKRFYKDQTGQLQKLPGSGIMYATAERRTVADATELAGFLAHLDTKKCLMWATFESQRVGIVSKDILKEMDADPGYAATIIDKFDQKGVRCIRTRTLENVRFEDGPGVMCLDFDFPTTDREVEVILARLAPGLARAAHVVIDSASTYIHDASTGEQLIGESRKHVYTLVSRAVDIPRAIKTLNKRAVAMGYAQYAWSDGGNILVRSVIDTGMACPIQIDFAAGAACVAPIVQRRPAPRVNNPGAPPADLKEAVPDLTPAEEAAWAREDAAARARLWENPHPKAKRPAQTDATAKSCPKAAPAPGGGYPKGECIRGDTMIEIPEYGTTISWWEITHDHAKYNGISCIDPFYTGKDGERRNARINLAGKKGIASFAGGGVWHYSQKVLTPPAAAKVEKKRPFHPFFDRRPVISGGDNSCGDAPAGE